MKGFGAHELAPPVRNCLRRGDAFGRAKTSRMVVFRGHIIRCAQRLTD